MSDLQTREQMLSELSHHNVIPEDAMKAAREAAAEAYPDARLSILAAMVDELYMVPIIARAILAERERSRTALSETEQRARREALEEAAKLVEQKLGGLMLDSFIFNDVRAKNEEGSTLFLSLERAQKVVEDRASAIRALIPSEPHDAEGRETPRRGDPSIFDDAEGRN